MTSRSTRCNHEATVTRRSIHDLANDLRTGRATARVLAERFLEQEATTRDTLHAFVHVDPDAVLAEADRADAELAAGLDRGPLHGILVGVKDITDVAGQPTRCGSSLYPDAPAERDAPVVTRLRDAGAVIAGKTTCHELACGVVSSPASNPWGTDRVPGGSSGGSGVAVATGLVPVALGSDTGGSIRIPASLCGTVGLKPTYGLVPVDGTEPLSSSLDHLGPLGATVADCALTLNVLAANGVDHTAGLETGVDGLTIGVLRDGPFAPAQPDVRDSFETAVETLRELGATVVPISIDELRFVLAIEFGLIPLEAFLHHQQSLRERPLDIDPAIRALLIGGAVSPLSIHRRAKQARRMVARAVLNAMESSRLDVLMAPTLPATAALKGVPEQDVGDGVMEHIGWSNVRTTAPFNVTGQPAVSVPSGFDAQGLPIGIQFAARPGRDLTALSVAAEFERAAGVPDLDDRRIVERRAMRAGES
jgi:aspartyl-tRNA(Asn)/glutamyl-tRNA(Gln) amidotransferase subunit A